MLCQNCGKNQINFRYTQVINGVKKEMALCDECARNLGIEGMDFNMPINFSSFFSDFFNDAESLLPSFAKINLLECDNCGTTFDSFVNSGEFGCGNCYITFADTISPVLKHLHGSNKHIGRQYKDAIDELEYNKNKFKENLEANKKQQKSSKQEVLDKKEIQLKKLQKELEEAIKDERYEDAAKLRDQIKDIK